MAIETKNELESFQQFLHRHLSDSGDKLSPEECLQLWRAEHPTSWELEESIAAVQHALQQAEAGEGVSLEEFDREFTYALHIRGAGQRLLNSDEIEN